MNDIVQALINRKSTRAFLEKQISLVDKNLILTASVNAPTAGNQQLYTILDITSVDVKKSLSILCDNQPFIAKAPLVLIFLADPKKWHDAYLAVGLSPRKLQIGDLVLAIDDALVASQNAVTCAESLGIGSCYIGDIMENHNEVKNLLHLPSHVFPAGMLVFGFPTEQQINRPKPARVHLKHIVHENSYRTMDHVELEEMFSPKAVDNNYEKWLTSFCNRKFNSDFSIEMSNSISKYFRDFDY